MGVFPLLVCVLLVAEPAAMGQPTTTTAASADPANVSTSHVSEDDPTTSATHLNATQSGPGAPVNEPTAELLLLYRASTELKRLCLPVVIVAGTFGNVVVVVIQRRLPPGQNSCMSVYFTALAVSDTTALWTAWFWTLETFGVTLSVEYHVQRDYSDVMVDVLCRIRVWISYAFGEISAWLLVFMTIHRAFSIVWPHRAREVLTTRNTRKVVACVISFCALSNAHLLYGHSLLPAGPGQTAECFLSFVSESYGRFFNLVWIWVDMVMAVFLPFACLLVTNTVLVRKVGQSLKEARESLAEGHGSDPFAARDRKLSSMTLTLIVMSGAFLLLTSPINFMYMVRMLAHDTGNDVRLRATSELAFSVGLVLWFGNVAINFYLYCLTGARYRAEFLRLFGCGTAATQRVSSHSTETSRQQTGSSVKNMKP